MALLRFIARVVLFVLLSFAVAVAAALAASPSTGVPSPALPRVLGPVDEAARSALAGNLHPAIRQGGAQAGRHPQVLDQGPVEDSFPAGRMLLVLKRSPQQEAALEDFLHAAHTPGNPAFHQWLKPQEFGRLYGPADSDLAAVTSWLESHGLTVQRIHAGRVAIEFSATAGQMREAFRTELHRYLIGGQTHLANATEPSIPAALAPVVAGLAQAHDFHPQPQLKVLGQARFNPQTHQAAPLWTYAAGGGVSYVVTPGDFATQYDINPVYKSGIRGAGQSIAIVSASNVDLSLVQAYEGLFGLGVNLPQVVVDGEDPGQNDAATEAYLDLELAGAVAPAAQIVLYTSGGTALTDGLALAALRAVEDDLAGVISTSYGECELELGQSGNAFWSALWQQAAAQGQTVFVAAGDSGSAGCDNFAAQEFAYGGLAVNGLASTPYNVAVGGTDFYYSQNTQGSSAVRAQLAAYWTAASTAPAVSLRQPVPEQAWNDFFGANLLDAGNPANLPGPSITAGGGGLSSAALRTGSTLTGYPKPGWQTGAGVAANGVRSLPDLSLFAANGSNLSFYAICANPGDCSSSNRASSGAVVVTSVGGTSASAPAMAAIQALVNQSTGSRQGQANFVYYPLAARAPGVFRDVTSGGNQVLCYLGTANCVEGQPGTIASGFSAESGYQAATGYDLATGLGSVDVANLIKYWKTVAFSPTVATLSVSPSTLVHGRTVLVRGTVASATGRGTPTGTVSLTSNDGLSHSASIDGIVLAGGSFSVPVDNLPGGSYKLTAAYGGDGAFAASKSAPVQVNVTPENPALAVSGWAWNPCDLYLYPLSAGIEVPYGAQIFLDAQPVSRNATLASEPTPATGTVSFRDQLGTASTVSAQPLNSAGVAEWSSGVFAVGAHALTASYSGDASYLASTAAAGSFTVIPGSTSLTVKPLVAQVAAGSTVSVDVLLAAGYLPLYGKLPTGKVTVTLGGRSVTAPWQAYGAAGDARLEAVVSFSNVAAGMLPLTASYAGDGNWMGSAANGGMVVALASKSTPAITLLANTANPAPGQTLTLTTTVAAAAGKPTPTGAVEFLGEGGSFSTAVNLTRGAASLSLPASSLANGSNVFSAVYLGDANYTQAASNPVNVAVAASDFSLVALTAELSIARGRSGAATLVLTPVNGFAGMVALTASAPAGIAAAPAKASLTAGAAASIPLSLSVAASVAPGVYPVNLIASGGGHIHAAQLLIAVPASASSFSPPAGTISRLGR